MDAVCSMLQREGWRSFYNGLVPAWIGSGVAWSAYFTAYEAIKALRARGMQHGERLPPLSHTLSAAQAGAMVCLMTNPIWVVKTRLQLQAGPVLPSWSGAAGAGAAGKTAAEAVATAVAASTTVDAAGSGARGTLLASSRSAASAAGPVGGAAAAAASTGAAVPSQPAHPAAVSQAAAPRAAGVGVAAARGLHASMGVPGPGPGPTGSAAAILFEQQRQYRGFVDALVCIGRQEGWRGFYKGLAPSLVLQTTHGAIQFTVYEELKHTAARWGAASNASPDRRIGSLETSAAAALSKLTASVVTYPSQVVRSRLQQRFDLGRTRAYHSTWEVIRLTWKGEGLRGFYKGLGPALLRVMPQSAITLVVYENVLEFLKARDQEQLASS